MSVAAASSRRADTAASSRRYKFSASCPKFRDKNSTLTAVIDYSYGGMGLPSARWARSWSVLTSMLTESALALPSQKAN